MFPLNAQDLRKPKMQSDARPVQEQSKTQTTALEQELAALRERVTAQSELLAERADQIADLKEDRDKWRQQATSLLAEEFSERTPMHKTSKSWSWIKTK